MTLAPVPTTPAESTRIATTGVLILQVTCGILARTACPLQSHGVLEVSFSGVLADSPRFPGFLEFQCIWIYRTQTAAPHGGPAKVSVG